MITLYDGSKVGVYFQAEGEFVFNQILTADECVGDNIWYSPANTVYTPVCTLLNGGNNASGGLNLSVPTISYGLNDNGRLVAVWNDSPTLIPCWTGEDDTDYGKLYWIENYNGKNII